MKEWSLFGIPIGFQGEPNRLSGSLNRNIAYRTSQIIGWSGSRILLGVPGSTVGEWVFLCISNHSLHFCFNKTFLHMICRKWARGLERNLILVNQQGSDPAECRTVFYKSLDPDPVWTSRFGISLKSCNIFSQ